MEPRVYFWLRDYIGMMQAQMILYPPKERDGIKDLTLQRQIEAVSEYLATWRLMPPDSADEGQL
jgi:hypothetical protein